MLLLKAVDHEVFEQNWFVLSPYSDAPHCVLGIHGGKAPPPSSVLHFVTWSLRSTIFFPSITGSLMRKPSLVSARSPSAHGPHTSSLATSWDTYHVFLLCHMPSVSCPYLLRPYRWPTAASLCLRPSSVACLPCLQAVFLGAVLSQ